MTRQLVYVKRKKGTGTPPQRNKSASLPRAAKTSQKPQKEASFDLPPPSDYVRPSTSSEANWYLRFVVTLGVVGATSLILVRTDIGTLTMDTLKALPSQYSAGWRGQDARLSGIDREAASRRPPPSEESFLATFRGRASSPN